MGKDIFDSNPDEGTLTKTNLVCSYYALFLRICKNTNPNRKIKYFDLFCGPGTFKNGIESVPIRLLKMINKIGINNIELYFNDNKKFYIEKLKENIKNNSEISNLIEICNFSNKDARDFNIQDLIRKDDIVLSYIDPSGHVGVSVDRVSSLINNYFSDLVLFININSVLRHISVENERENYISLCGTEANYERFKVLMNNKNICNEEKYDIFVKDFLDRLRKKMRMSIYCLPIILRYSGEQTEVFAYLLVISKSMKGIDKAKDIKDEYNYLHIQKGRIIGYEEQKCMINFNLFDDGSAELLNYIPSNRLVSREELIKNIDECFVNKYGYVSAYGEKTLNMFLRDLETNEKIEVAREKGGRRFTYGNKTRFRKK